jgi:hypothetical protein
VSLGDVTTYLPELRKKLEDIADETILFFWASSAMLAVRGSNIFDRAGKQIGMMTGKRHHPYPELHSEPREEEFIVVERHGSSMYEKYDYRAMVGVFWIEWKDGIAFRINSGEVEEDEWVKAERTWKLIPLG